MDGSSVTSSTLMREQYTRFKLLKPLLDGSAGNSFALSSRAPRMGESVSEDPVVLIGPIPAPGGSRAATGGFTSGAALMGQIYKRIFDRGIEVRLETKLSEILLADGRAAGVKVSNFGRGLRDPRPPRSPSFAAGGFRMEPGAARSLLSQSPASRATAARLRRPTAARPWFAGMQIGAADRAHGGGLVDPHHAHADANHIQLRGKSIKLRFDVGRPHSVLCQSQRGAVCG